MQPDNSAATYHSFAQNSPMMSSEDLDNNYNICTFTRELAKQQLASDANAVNTEAPVKHVKEQIASDAYVVTEAPVKDIKQQLTSEAYMVTQAPVKRVKQQPVSDADAITQAPVKRVYKNSIETPHVRM